MSGGLARWAAEEAVNEKIVDPEFCQLLANVLRRLSDGFYDPDWQDAIFQKWCRMPIDIYDAYAFARVWDAMMCAEILTATIHVGNGPVSDSQAAEMNRRLAHLPKPFKAK